MKPEIEVKFLDTDHDDVRSRLQSIGATLEQPMRLMRRTMFDYPDHRLQKANWGRVRVRDEGDKITLTYKDGNDQEYSREVETEVGSYEAAVQLLETIGLVGFSFQESKRETWCYDETEIVLDEWPWLKPYIEIESGTEAQVKSVAGLLHFDWEKRALGNIDTAYRAQYPKMTATETIGIFPELRFGQPVPQWLKDRR